MVIVEDWDDLSGVDVMEIPDSERKELRQLNAMLEAVASRLPCPTHGHQNLIFFELAGERMARVCCPKYKIILGKEMKKEFKRRNKLKVVSGQAN